MDFVVTTDIATINKMMATIAPRTKKLQNDLHIVAASCALHAIEFGNVTPMNEFFNACGKAIDRTAIVRFFETYGGAKFVVIKNDDGTKTYKFKADTEKMLKLKAERNLDQAKFDAKIAAAKFYEKFETAKAVFNGFDLNARIKALIKKAKDIKDDEAKASHPKNNFASLTKLEEFAATLN